MLSITVNHIIPNIINGLTPRCRRPPFKGGAAGNGQNGPHMAVSKPNRNSLWGLGMYHGKASGTPVKAGAEGCEVLRPSKAAAEVLRVLRPAENLPHGSFEAQ